MIEATEDPNFFGFYLPDLEGFSGIGNSIEDCIYKATSGMEEHLALVQERAMSLPMPTPNPAITIQDERRVLQTARGKYHIAAKSGFNCDSTCIQPTRLTYCGLAVANRVERGYQVGEWRHQAGAEV